MTDFNKVENYYKHFDEWNRTFTPEGLFEFEITIDIMLKYTKVGSNVLDLGGGPGRYTQELAQNGRMMSLGDISPELVAIAKEKNKDNKNIKSIDVVNAVNLGIYENSSFDCVLLMGPLYHLTESYEIHQSLKEVFRILKNDGVIIAGFIPHLSGTAGIIERSIYAPHQVTPEILGETFNTGIFRNNSETGFQEGIYLSSKQVNDYMAQAGFEKILLRSTRGLGYKLEKGIIEKKISDPILYQKIVKIIEASSEDEAVINTCGHALYIGKKNV